MRWFAVAVFIGMQAGTIFKPLGNVGQTRVADWVDLLTPYAVLGAAALILAKAHATRREWVLLGFGGITFTLGHGMHLSANSISNVQASDIIHLWDEVVSHYVWYIGLFLVMAAIVRSLRGHEMHFAAIDYLLWVLLAVSLFNNYIEGGTPWLGVLFMATAVGTALRWRPDAITRPMLVVSGSVLLLLLCWGTYWFIVESRMFPQFSELGWI